MAVTTQVEYEAHVRTRYAAIALAAAVLVVVSQMLQFTGQHPSVNELTLSLIAANANATKDTIGAVIYLLGLGAVAVTLSWLHQATQARKPDARSIIRYLAIGGAVLAALAGLTSTIMVSIKAHQFVTTGAQTYPEADALTRTTVLILTQLLEELGLFVLTIGCIWVSLNAMRVGLITRLIGYVGVLAGALFLFPLGGLVPVVQGYWLVAFAGTFAARWPSGDPPAWRSGEAVAWAPLSNPNPPTQPQRRQRGANRRAPAPSSRPAGGLAGGLGSLLGFGRRPAAPRDQAAPPEVPKPPRAGTPKLKRKRRS
jgi:F0F1-type ATP synthase membrane subunit c/vacuolar-type H+-ATPase subunit K